MEKKATLIVIKPNGYAYEEEFDTRRDALKCAQHLPCGCKHKIKGD